MKRERALQVVLVLVGLFYSVWGFILFDDLWHLRWLSGHSDVMSNHHSHFGTPWEFHNVRTAETRSLPFTIVLDTFHPAALPVSAVRIFRSFQIHSSTSALDGVSTCWQMAQL